MRRISCQFSAAALGAVFLLQSLLVVAAPSCHTAGTADLMADMPEHHAHHQSTTGDSTDKTMPMQHGAGHHEGVDCDCGCLAHGSAAGVVLGASAWPATDMRLYRQITLLKFPRHENSIPSQLFRPPISV